MIIIINIKILIFFFDIKNIMATFFMEFTSYNEFLNNNILDFDYFFFGVYNTDFEQFPATPDQRAKTYHARLSFNEDQSILNFIIYYTPIIEGNVLFGTNGEISTQSVSKNLTLNVVDNEIRGNFNLLGLRNGPLFFMSFRDIRDLRSFQSSTLSVPLQYSVNNGMDNQQSTLNINKLRKLRIDDDIFIELSAQTDIFGLNLGEMAGVITSNKNYPNGYPKKLIGYCQDVLYITAKPQTLYSARPKIQKVLKGEGNTLLEQTNNINCLYDTGLSNCDFYLNIIAYCTFRYMLAGFSNGFKFSLKWLCANHYEQFLINLKNSEFSEAIIIFTEPQEEFDFTNFNRYFKDCPKKHD
jgi:hypothetical protein